MAKGGAGKRKGAGFERKVCTQLSLWVSDGKLKDCFWRSAMSGGRATVHRLRGTKLNRQAGDVCAISPEGIALTTEFYIECKHYRSLDLDNFMLAKGNLFRFWGDTVAAAQHHERQPMLIAKQNRTPTLLITRIALNSAARWHSQIVFKAGYESAFVYLFEEVLKHPLIILE